MGAPPLVALTLALTPNEVAADPVVSMHVAFVVVHIGTRGRLYRHADRALPGGDPRALRAELLDVR